MSPFWERLNLGLIYAIAQPDAGPKSTPWSEYYDGSAEFTERSISLHQRRPHYKVHAHAHAIMNYHHAYLPIAINNRRSQCLTFPLPRWLGLGDAEYIQIGPNRHHVQYRPHTKVYRYSFGSNSGINYVRNAIFLRKRRRRIFGDATGYTQKLLIVRSHWFVSEVAAANSGS